MKNQSNPSQLNWIIPSQRVESVSEYFFAKKLQEVERLRQQGHDVLNLGIGNPDLPPYQKALDALMNDAQKEDANGYQPYRGILTLRKAMKYWYEKWYDVELDSQTEILPLMGSKEGILHITWALTNPGDKVLIPNPGYPTYASVSALAGLEICHYDLKEENSWEPNFEEIEKQDLTDVKIMWVNYPNMPTGQQASMELFKKIIEFGKKHQIIIINDNPYSFILEENPKSILQVEGAKDICIELNSLSKSHHMAGWRSGMVCGNPQLVAWVAQIQSNITSGQYRPIQNATIEALSCDIEWHQKNNAIYQKRQKIAMEILDSLGCTFSNTQKGMFVWAQSPKDVACDMDFCDQVLEKADIFITPGSIFGSNGKGYVRISLCANEEILQEALNRIKKINNLAATEKRNDELIFLKKAQ